MPSSPESLMDMVNLFIGNDFFEHLVRKSNRYQVMERYRIIKNEKVDRYNDTRNEEIFRPTNSNGTSKEGRSLRLLVH